MRVIVNREGGLARAAGDALSDRIEAAFRAAGCEAEISLCDGSGLAGMIRRAPVGVPLVIGGGDGTVRCAVQERLASGAEAGAGGALAILPLGTRNHLARELGIPLDLDGAALVAVGGHGRRIDLGCLNGQLFLNNASVGFYPLLVRWREAERERGLPRWLATIPASWSALRRFRHHNMYLQMTGASGPIRTPILFVGNNRYILERGQLGRRAALDDGTLSVIAVAARSRLGLLWFAARALVGLVNPDRDFAALGERADLIVHSRSRLIDVAVDGEVLRFELPLRFSVRPRSLEVRVPA